MLNLDEVQLHQLDGVASSEEKRKKNLELEKTFDLPRGFKGIWIPREIWESRDLSSTEKNMWAEIDSLSLRDEGCTATNQYFCNFFNLKERAVQTAISKLKKMGLIEQVSFDGRKRTLVSLHPRGAEKCTPRVQKNAPLPTPLYKEENKEENTLKEVCEFFASMFKKANPDLKTPSPTKKDLEALKELQQQVTHTHLLKIIEWAVSHAFWGSRVLNFCSLERNLLQIQIQMKEGNPESIKKLASENLKILASIKRLYPDENRFNLRYGNDYIEFCGGAESKIILCSNPDFVNIVSYHLELRGIRLPARS